MKTTLASLAFAALVPSLSAQVDVLWNASAGLLPEDSIPAWDPYLGGGGCATAALQPNGLELDTTGACAPSDLSYASIRTGLTPYGPSGAVYIAEARCQVLQSSDVDPDRGVAAFALAQVYTCPWILEIERDRVDFYYGSEWAGSLAIDTTSTMRTYRIESEAGSFEGRAFVDGQLIATVTTTQQFCGQIHQTQRGAIFGNLWGTEPGVTRWESVTHNAGNVVEGYCSDPFQPNSLGSIASINLSGSPIVADNDASLFSYSVPPGSFGYYLCSRDYSARTPIAGSQGALCLSGSIGRFNRAGEILVASSNSYVSLDLDLTALPQPTGPVAAQSGESWHFQLWHRDANPGPTSNLSSALRVQFQ